MTNLILNTDSYKHSHWLQNQPGLTHQFSYVESRGGRFQATLFFGLQYTLKKYFTAPITEEMVSEAADVILPHGLPFNKDGWLYIVRELGGKLPLRIRAVPEGSVIPTHNVLVTVENTDSKCPWLTSFVETALLRAVWYGTTVATQSFFIKKSILASLQRTSDEPEKQIPFKLHDFGARGVSSYESACIGGAAHLVNFLGTDTISGMEMAMNYYNAKSPVGFSIPASEHSTITAFGKEGETDAYRNMINQFGKPGAIFAAVSDSYDLDNAVDNIWGQTLRDEVIKSGATVVIRPDSGDPVKVVLRTITSLADNFGYYVNNKGYKVLKYVRVIQGDGVNEHSIEQILETLEKAGFSADNVAFGMGGKLLQAGLDRDTQKFAYKCSSVVIDGKTRDVFKDPVTDPGKRSKAGRLDLVKSPDGQYRTVPYLSQETVMQTVYQDGVLLKDHTWDEIKKRANEGL